MTSASHSARDTQPRTAKDHDQLRAELLARIEQVAQGEERAALHVQLGHLLRGRFLDGVAALRHFQDAFKADPLRLDAVGAARTVYRQIGRLPLVERLLALEIEALGSSDAAADLYRELGDVLLDGGNAVGAARAYDSAVERGALAAELLVDAEAGDDGWAARVAQLVELAEADADTGEQVALLLRAAAVAKPYSADQAFELVARAYRLDPESERAASLFEGAYVESDAIEELVAVQEELLAAEPGSRLYEVFGARWAHRHVPEVSVPLLLEALRRNPGLEPAVTHVYVAAAEVPEARAQLVEVAEAVGPSAPSTATYLLATAALVAAQDLNNISKARSLAEQLLRLDDTHPVALALTAAALESAEPTTDESRASTAPAKEKRDMTQDPRNMEETSTEATELEEADGAVAETATADDDAAAVSASAGAAPKAAATSPAEVAQLREKLAAAEKRPHEYVKLLIQLGDALGSEPEAADRFREAALLYAEKNNAAEASKAYEKLLAVDVTDASARAYLRDVYEKQRKFDKLVDLMKQEADALDAGPDRASAYKQIAILATDKIKKPEICVELWTVVLDNDAEDADALSALVGLYERARDYEKLVDALERVVVVTYDDGARVEYLTKLGQIAGDRLKDEERAAEAYRQLLVLRPDDRRAQEQLKKRYVALGRWDDLEVFYQESGNWEEFIRLLESNESKAETQSAQIGMLGKIAELWITQKGQPDRAARALEKVLTIDSSNLDAAERLIPIYESGNNPKGLVAAIEVKLGHVHDTAGRIELLTRVASLYDERLRDKASALSRYLEAVKLDPSNASNLDAAEKVAEGAKTWDALVAAYRDTVPGADDDSAVALRLRLGRILSEKLGNAAEAIAEYRAVYDDHPDDTEALSALEGLYQKTGGWKELLQVYEQKLSLPLELEERKATQYGIARVQREKLGDAELAIETYETVLAEDADDGVALAALDELYGATEEWEKQAHAISQRIERAEPDGALVELKFRLAEVQSQKLGSSEEALENYREVLQLDLAHPGARASLEGFLDDDELKGEAARILETVLEQQEAWDKLARVLEVRASVESGAERVELLRKLAVVSAEHLGSPEEAMNAQARALKADPGNETARSELESLAERSRALPALAKIFSLIASESKDDEVALDYHMRVARLFERLSEVDSAAAAYGKALGVDAAHQPALLALDALYRGAGRFADLVGVYRKRIELAADPDEFESLHAALAEVLDTQLGKPDEAVVAYQDVLEQSPSSRVALAALDTLFTKLERWDDLATNLESQLALADTEGESIELTLRLATLREKEMSQVEAAIDGYREVLERDASEARALAALERLLGQSKYELVVGEILEPIYRSSGQYQKLISVHEIQLKKSDDVERKVELLDAIRELYEDAGGNSGAAFDAAARALEVDPSSDRIRGTLTRLASATDRFRDLGAILETRAAATDDTELASQLYAAGAVVFEESVGDSVRAIELHKKVLSVDPTALSAAEALERLYRQTEQFAEMSLILQKKAGMLDDIELQKQALYAAATLEEEVLEQPEKAIAVYEQVLELDAEDVKSVEALIGLLLGLSRWKDLLTAYARKVDLVFDVEEKKQVLYEVGAVHERELSDVESAIDTYQRVLELDPDDLIALGRLDVLYQTAENWSELLSVLTREAELAADPEESVSYQFRVAKLYETRLGDVERAVDLYRELLQVQPDHDATLAALEQLQKGSKAALAASQVLEQVYEASADAEKLIAALEVQVGHAEDAFQKVGLLRRIAQIAEESLSAPERAFSVYARAVAADSSNGEVLESFERLATMTDGWKRAAEVYDAELANEAEDPAQIVELGLRVAQIYEVQLEDSRAAVQRYQTVLESESANLVALAALDRLFSAAEDWVSLAKVLAEEAEYGDSPEAILEFKFRLGEVSRSYLGNVPGAIAAYREVLAAAPEHEGALGALEQLFSRGVEVPAIAETLEPLYQVAGEWEKLLDIREGVLAKLVADEPRVELLQRMSEEAESKLGDVDRAFEYLVRALGEQPDNQTTVDEIERLADVADEGWERLANAYADVMSAEGASGAVIAASGRRLARVYEEQLSDTPRAVETYRFVLGRVPADLAALENLDRIYTAAESWSELAPVLEVRAKAVEDDFDKVELYLRLGHTYEEKLAPLGDGGTVDRSVLGGSGELSRRAASSEATEVLSADDEELLTDEEAQVTEPSLDDLFPAEAEADLDAEPAAEDFAQPAAGLVQVDGAPSTKPETGPLNSERLQDAIRAYRVVFDGLEPENQDAIESLERVYRITGEWKNLDVVFQRQLDNSSGDSEEADIRAKRAHLAADHLGDLAGAVAGWKRVLDLRGEDPEALRALAYLYEKQGQWSELTDVLERHFDIADSDDDRVHVLLMRAKLFDEQLNRDEEALETYRRALDIDYSNVTALRAIAKIWRRRQDDDELITALHAFVDQGAAQVEAKELVEAFRELAKLYQDKKEQPFDAADAWRRLLEVGPGDFEALDRLEGIYRAESQWTDIIDVKMQRASALVEPEEKVRELLEVTDLWKQEVREYDKAVTAYARVLAVEPTHQRAFVELEKLHSHAERYEQLIELYLNRLEHAEEVPARSDLLRRIARVFEEKLGDHDQAFDALVNAFADDYYDDETANFLGRVCQAANRWPELLTNANAWLQAETDRRKKIQLSLRLGKWYGEDLGRPADATAYYQVVLEIDPNNTRVMRQMAAIERLGGNYQRAGQMLNKALEVAVANDDRKAILGDLGDVLYRNLEQVEQAIPYYKRALDVDAGYMPALTALERIYEDKGQIPELIEILTRKATSVDRPEDAVKMKLRLGELCEERLGDADGAAKAYREALAVDESSLPALRGLERTLFKLGQWAELIKALEQQLDIVDTERERVRVLMKLAEIHEQQFLKPDVAAQRLEQALEVDHAQEDAYVALARCYRRLKQWNDLVRTCERHLETTQSRETKLELYAAIGAVYRDELGELDRAIDSYQAVVDADDTNIAALDALAKLYERQDDSARAIDMMTRVADLTADGAQRVDMYFRIGRSMEEKLGDRFGAREKFQIALDLNPAHLQSLAALRTIAVDEADWDAACRYLEQEASHTDAPRQKARLLVELGKIRDEMLSERDSAIAAYEQAIALDEDCEEAALPLVKEYGERERWADAAPLAEMLARRSKNRDKSEQHELSKLLGNVMAKLGDHDKALKAYLAAHQLDLTDQETIRGVADAAYALTDWATALTNYQKVLTALGEGDVEARTDVYFRLGKIKEAQGQDKQAINNYEKALALDGEHRPSLEALVEVYGKTGDHQQVAAYKRQILDTIFDGEERFAILSSIGDLWSEKVNQPLKALEAYEEARDLKPQDHVLLHKMVRCYQQAEEWQKMVDVLDAILAIEERAKLKAKLLNTQAQIYRDMLEDKAKAVELFNEALDLDPEFLEAFERINKMLTTERNWKQLERSYRKMLHRIAGKNKQELEHQLWHQLGLIYRDRTGQTQEAVQAFKMSAELASGDAVMQRQILAELYEQSEQWDDAIKEQRRLLKADPLAPEAYQALYRLYLHKQAYDESWALAAALAFMGKADGDQMRFYEDYRPKGMLRVAGRFGEEHWQRALIHSEQTQLVSEVFKMITPAAVQAKLTQLKAQNKLPKLDERFRQDPATSTITFAKTFGWASQVLGVQPPTLYVRNDVSAYLGAVPSSPPASVAGQLVLSGFQPEELTFICGKHLALYRPEAYLKVLFPTQAELTIMFFAGVLLAAPQTPMPPDMDQPIRAAAQELARHMQPVHVEGLKQAVKAWLGAGAKANIKRWSQAVEHTACRAGLIVCCDLNVAKKIIASEQQIPGEPTAQEKLKELLTFAVSVEYSALRKVLGVNVQA